MAINFEKWLKHEFSSSGDTGEDFKQFTKEIKAWLKKDLANKGLTFTLIRNHYRFSGFIFNPETKKYVYYNIPDVRFWPGEWYKTMLFRTANSDTDYHGGFNQRCQIFELADQALKLIA